MLSKKQKKQKQIKNRPEKHNSIIILSSLALSLSRLHSCSLPSTLTFSFTFFSFSLLSLYLNWHLFFSLTLFFLFLSFFFFLTLNHCLLLLALFLLTSLSFFLSLFFSLFRGHTNQFSTSKHPTEAPKTSRDFANNNSERTLSASSSPLHPPSLHSQSNTLKNWRTVWERKTRCVHAQLLLLLLALPAFRLRSIREKI